MPDRPQADEQPDSEVTVPVTGTDGAPADSEPDGDVFPRKVVEDLRRESATYRDRAKTAEARADELARALFAARVEATGKLADAGDLDFDAELLDDADALDAAIDALIEKRPHYAKRRVSGAVGQGNQDSAASAPTFSDLFR